MRPEKEMMVNEISKAVAGARSILLANYMGLKARELEEFRNILKPMSSDCMIVKNRLLARAISKASLPPVDDYLVGPTAIIFGQCDDVLLAKRVMQFSKDHEMLKVKIGILDKNLIDKDQVACLSLLPGREVLIAQLIGSLRSPLGRLVRVLGALQRGLVVALNAIKEKKGA